MFFEAALPEEVKTAAHHTRIFDVEVYIFVVGVVDGVAVGLVDHDGVADVAGDVVEAGPGHQQSQFYYLLFVEFEA
jgi:hypothetical protein